MASGPEKPDADWVLPSKKMNQTPFWLIAEHSTQAASPASESCPLPPCLIAKGLGRFSVVKPTTWLVFSSGIDVAVTRPWSDDGRIAAARRRTRIRRQLVCFSPVIALAQEGGGIRPTTSRPLALGLTTMISPDAGNRPVSAVILT
jgi:hypothetical protein